MKNGLAEWRAVVTQFWNHNEVVNRNVNFKVGLISVHNLQFSTNKTKSRKSPFLLQFVTVLALGQFFWKVSAGILKKKAPQKAVKC